MKRILLSFITLVIAQAAMAQCPPTFTWVASPNSNNLLNVNFTNTTVFAGPNTSFPNYTIKYGDGNQSSLYGTQGHNYTAPGTYTAWLIIHVIDSLTQANICIDSVSHVVTVGYTPCATSFTQVSGSNGAVTFTAVTPSNNPTISYGWNFGDGYTGAGSPITHTYTSNGNYNVVLTATTTAAPCSYVNSHNVSVSNGGGGVNVISGQVIDSPSVAQDTFKVWLITFNASTNMLAAVDSQMVTSSNGYAFYNKPAGTYMTKAKMMNQPNNTTGFIPTYHFSSLYWSTANNINHTGGASAYNTILMQMGTVTSGPGFIGGNVNQGANKGTGAPVPNIEVILRDASNNPVQYTYTNASGDYSFSNLPIGTYSIYPEELNFISTPFTGVQITAAAPSATGFIFGVNNNDIKPKTTGVAGVANENNFSIYPNPTSGKVSINWTKIPAEYAVTIADVAGHVVYKANNKSELSLTQLQSGMYFIKVSTGATSVTQKLMMQH